MFVVSCSLFVVHCSLFVVSCSLLVDSAAKVKGAQTPRKSACKEPRIQVVLTVKIGGSLPRGSGQSALVFPTISGVGRGAKRGSERNRYAGNRSNFAARRTGPGSGVRDVINVSQALLNPRCAPSIPQRPLRSAPYSINTLKRCSDEADRQTGFTGMGAIPAIHPRRNGHPDRAMPVAEREKRRQWPLRHIPPRMDQRAVPTPLLRVPGQTSPAAAAAPDDFDTDEECRNPKIIADKWNWFEQALYFTRSFSEPLLVIWCGNIIARDCCIARAGARARELAGRDKPLGNWDIINIRMVDIRRPDPKRDFAEGVSVWPEKNTEAMIDEVPLRRCRPPRCKRNASTTQWLKGRTSKRSHGVPCPRLISFLSSLVMATRHPPIVPRTARA